MERDTPDFHHKTLVLDGPEKQRWVQLLSGLELDVIDYATFFRTDTPETITEAAHLLKEATRLLKTLDISSGRRYSSLVFRRFSKKIWREAWNRHHDEDKVFIDAEIHPVSESRILSSECLPGWSIASIDMNAMFPWIVANLGFMHPGRMVRFTGEPPVDAPWFAECNIHWNPAATTEERAWFASFHPFLEKQPYLRRNPITGLPASDHRMVCFKLDDQDMAGPIFKTWLSSDEIASYSRFITAHPIHGISAPRIDHPLASSMAWFIEERFRSDNKLTKQLCKSTANIASSSSYHAPDSWNPWLMKWRMDDHAVREIKGVFSLSVLMKCHARRLMVEKLWWMHTNLPAHEVAYTNVDAIHFMSLGMKACLDKLEKDGNIGDSPGQWKVEWTAKRGVWPSPRYYWLRDVILKDGTHQDILHASLDKKDPYARGVEINMNGSKRWLSQEQAWRNSRNHNLHALRWNRLLLPDALKRTNAQFSSRRLVVALGKLLEV